MASSSVREPPFRVAVEKNVTAVLRDGTVLRADLYHPDLKGKFPTIIERTPYDKGSFAERGNSFAERGYLYVAQDIRGRYASDGDFSGGFYRRDHTEADDPQRTNERNDNAEPRFRTSTTESWEPNLHCENTDTADPRRA